MLFVTFDELHVFCPLYESKVCVIRYCVGSSLAVGVEYWRTGTSGRSTVEPSVRLVPKKLIGPFPLPPTPLKMTATRASRVCQGLVGEFQKSEIAPMAEPDGSR